MAALSAAQKPADASFVTISGMVKDQDSKKGIPGVSISLEGGKPDEIVAEAIKKNSGKLFSLPKSVHRLLSRNRAKRQTIYRRFGSYCGCFQDAIYTENK